MKQYQLAINGNPYTVKILELGNDTVTAEVNGIRHAVEIKDIENLALFANHTEPQRPQVQPAPTAGAGMEQKKQETAGTVNSVFGSENILAPIPGQIIAIQVAAGQEVAKGEPILVLEAMKMENIIAAKRAGVVGDVCVSIGEAVTQNQLLVTMA